MSRHAKPLVLLLLTAVSAGCGSLENATGPDVPAVPLAPGSSDLLPEPASDNLYALKFSGISSRVDIPYSPEYKPLKFTVELWVQVTSQPSLFTPLIASSNTNEWNTADGFSLKFESNRAYLRAAKASNLAAGYYASFVPPPGRWTHLAGSFDGEYGRVYVNGELVAAVPDQRPTWYGTRGLVFGAGIHSLFGGASHFHGMMDEIRIWNHARSGDEIRKAMDGELTGSEPGLVGYWNFERPDGATVFDASPSANHGLKSGLATYVSTTPF